MAEYEDVLTRLAADIEALDARRTSMVRFVQAAAENISYFTAEELDLCRATVAQFDDRLARMRQELDTKLAIYETTVKTLHEGLAVRAQLIETYQNEGAFAEDDEVLQKLVQTHAQLSQKLQEAEEQLL